MFKKRLFLGIFFLAVLIFIIFPLFKGCQKLTCINLNSLNGFKEKEIYTYNKNIYRAEYVNENLILKAETDSNISFGDAVKLKNSIKANFESFYNEGTAPYPGEISNTVKCNPDRKPKINDQKIDNIVISYFFSKLNKRMVYACNESEDFYNSVTALFYCQNQKKAYHLELISPLDIKGNNPDLLLNKILSVRCNK